MSERDPFEQLRELIDQPVEPRTAFANALHAHLVSELPASELARKKQQIPMDGLSEFRQRPAFAREPIRHIRPLPLLELAAVAVVVLGLIGVLSRGWFGNEPESPASAPAAVLQADRTPAPDDPPEQVPSAVPTAALEGGLSVTPVPNSAVPTASQDGSLPPTPAPQPVEPAAAEPGVFPNRRWTLPAEQMDVGGLLVDRGVVYRLLATSDFVGVQAVDGETGAVLWQQAHRWAGHLFTIDRDTLYFDGGGNTLTAMDAETGAQRWRVDVADSPLAITVAGERIFALLDNDMMAAVDERTGDQLWVAQGPSAQHAVGGSASDSLGPLLAVEDNTVAYIATNGVLSGHDVQTGELLWWHDVQTGELLWSHKGFEAATSSIQAEDGRFIVIGASGLYAGGREVDARGGIDGTLSASPAGPADCNELFGDSELGTATALPPTPEGATTIADVLRVQAIDPATGEILWDGRAAPGVGTALNLLPAGATVDAVCAVEIETGRVISLADGEQSADAVVIGVLSGGMFYTRSSDLGIEQIGAAIGSAAQMPGSEVIFAVASDGLVILQRADGSLVGVESGSANRSSDTLGTPSPVGN